MAMAPRRSLIQAAEALDLSRRQVAYYANKDVQCPLCTARLKGMGARAQGAGGIDGWIR
jgi:hypothetical protein